MWCIGLQGKAATLKKMLTQQLLYLLGAAERVDWKVKANFKALKENWTTLSKICSNILNYTQLYSTLLKSEINFASCLQV